MLRWGHLCSPCLLLACHPGLASRCLHALQAHAVVLNLESKLCEQRAEQRQGHEGHLEGPKARVAAKRMYMQLQKNLPSKAAEGLTSIMVRWAASKCRQLQLMFLPGLHWSRTWLLPDVGRTAHCVSQSL